LALVEDLVHILADVRHAEYRDYIAACRVGGGDAETLLRRLEGVEGTSNAAHDVERVGVYRKDVGHTCLVDILEFACYFECT